MQRLGKTRTLLLIALALLVLSILLSVASIYPLATGNRQSTAIINDTFTLNPHEIRRQGLGAFQGGEKISMLVESPSDFPKNFSIVTYNGLRYSNATGSNITYAFTAGADYYEAVFVSSYPQSGIIYFKVEVQKAQVTYPLAFINTAAKALFFASVSLAMLVLLKLGLGSRKVSMDKMPAFSVLTGNARRNLQRLILVSLTFWLILLLINVNSLGTFENWYTDHARHPYTASLFFKDGFSVFSQPLDTLASKDNSYYQYVTWPEMPHLYPLGSILLFMPFGSLLQNGVDSAFVFKLEIAFFLFFAHLCLYFFLSRYWKQNMFHPYDFKEWKHDIHELFRWGNWSKKKLLLGEHTHLVLKLVGVYIIYATLITFAADGMFDSVALLFALFALTMFFTERYDVFLFFMAISIFFKYQTGIFLFPIILVGALKLAKYNKLSTLHNWKVLAATALLAVSGFTALLSSTYLVRTRPELIMNGINAFSSHSQIPWMLQSSAILLTLAGSIAYSLFMLNRNHLLSLSALFLLVPSFILPYFQNWYLSFIFIYALIPQRRIEIVATIVWLVFMLTMLSFGGAAFNPVVIMDNFKTFLRI